MTTQEVLIKIVDSFTFVAKWMTNQIAQLLAAFNLTATPRATGLFTFLFVVLISYIIWRVVAQPLAKWIILITLGLIALSFFVPGW